MQGNKERKTPKLSPHYGQNCRFITVILPLSRPNIRKSNKHFWNGEVNPSSLQQKQQAMLHLCIPWKLLNSYPNQAPTTHVKLNHYECWWGISFIMEIGLNNVPHLCRWFPPSLLPSFPSFLGSKGCVLVKILASCLCQLSFCPRQMLG